MNNGCNCSCSTNFMQTDMVPEGWRCPVCKRILSPWTIMCPCNGQGLKTEWTTSTESTTNETITLTNDGNLGNQEIHTYYNKEENNENK